MNFAINKAFLIFLAASALSSLLSGCKSAVTSKTPAKAGIGTAKIEKEPSVVRPDDLIKRGEIRSINQSALSALKIMKENAPKVRLNEYFNAIANADNASSANTIISKALAMFASSTIPVLLEVPDKNGKSNYDKSITILAYFNYIKTLKKNLDDIKNLKIDGNGKIIEVELTKNNLIPVQ